MMAWLKKNLIEPIAKAKVIRANNKKQIQRVFKGIPKDETPDEKWRREQAQLKELKERLRLKESAIQPDKAGPERSVRG